MLARPIEDPVVQAIAARAALEDKVVTLNGDLQQVNTRLAKVLKVVSEMDGKLTTLTQNLSRDLDRGDINRAKKTVDRIKQALSTSRQELSSRSNQLDQASTVKEGDFEARVTDLPRAVLARDANLKARVQAVLSDLNQGNVDEAKRAVADLQKSLAE